MTRLITAKIAFSLLDDEKVLNNARQMKFFVNDIFFEFIIRGFNRPGGGITVDSYLNKNFFDTQRNKCRPVSVLGTGEKWTEMETEDGRFMIIYNGLDDPKEYQTRLEWLLAIKEKLELNGLLAFPTATLSGLKRGEVGYVAEVNNKNTLSIYIRPGKGEKLFKWYNDKTGGIYYRLKIAYRIVNAIINIHANGLCLVDISPNHIRLQEFNIEKPEEPNIQFTGIDRISSYTYAPITSGADTYCDPMIYMKRSSVSTLSDAYSLAVIIFELLTTCHPFIGEDAEGLSGEEMIQAINKGELTYIGDTLSEKNRNEVFEDTRFFLPEELSTLFEKMFVDGKFDVSMRPTLADFKAAIIQSQSKIISCDHKGCKRVYPYNKEHICSFCGYQTKKVLIAHIKRVITSSEKILLPYDGIKIFSNLPQIENDVNFVVIREGVNRIIRINFEPNATSDHGQNGILIYYVSEKGKITIRNRFKRLSIYADGTELTPYKRTDKEQLSDASFDDDKQIIIKLPDNAQIYPERIVEIESEQYGSVNQQWVVTIR